MSGQRVHHVIREVDVIVIFGRVIAGMEYTL